MTSPGLSELKRLINEAALRKIALQRSVSKLDAELAVTKRKLRNARLFIVRLFTKARVSRLTDLAKQQSAALAQTREELESCFVEVEFGLDAASTGTFAALCRSFQNLIECQKIWDILASVETDRVKQRTTAAKTVTRSAVVFDFSEVDVIQANCRSMRLQNVSGLEIHLFPGFILTKEQGSDFALLEWGEVAVKAERTRFIETEDVPTDSVNVGYTWQYANKDGSPDRRFNDNRQIPIMEYGELWFRSPTGLNEAYMASSATRVANFASDLSNHQRAVANVQTPMQGPANGPERDVEAQLDEDGDSPYLDSELSEPAETTRVFDWIGLVIICAFLVYGGFWINQNGATLGHGWTQQPLPTEVGQATVQNSGERLPKATVAARMLNIRAEPSARARVVTRAALGTELNVFDRRGSWSQVGQGRPIGWAQSKLLSITSLQAPVVVKGEATRGHPSFDCNKARLPSEQLVCSDPSLASMDVELAALYTQARQVSGDSSALIDEQRGWLWQRDQCSTSQCVRESYIARKSDISRWLVDTAR